MTIEDGKNMNKNFTLLKDSISIYKYKKDSILKEYDKYFIYSKKYIDSVKINYDSLLYKFNYNKVLIMEREKTFRQDRNFYQGFIFAPYVLLLLANILNL
jgi:hypothetical protein